MCSRSRTVPKPRFARPRTGRAPGSIQTWLPRLSASRRSLGSGTCLALKMGTRLLASAAGAGERAGRRGLSRRYRGRLRPGGRFQEPLHQRPQRARHALYRHDRGAAGVHGRAATLAQARRAAARHRQARRQQRHPRQAGQARRRRMGRSCASIPRIPRRSCRASARSAILLRSPARITSGWTARAIPVASAGDQICLETRIITTADIFDALTADRPYRAAMPVTKALAIMSEMVGTQIDADCFAALRRALGRVDETLAA